MPAKCGSGLEKDAKGVEKTDHVNR